MGRQKPSLVHEPMYGGQNSLIANGRSRKQDPPWQQVGAGRSTIRLRIRTVSSPPSDEVVNIGHCIQRL
jgi:hypothetical protein